MDDASLWAYRFPQLAGSTDPTIQRLLTKAQVLRFPSQTCLVTQGANCENYLLVVSGSLRVQVLTDTGRKLVLYHVRAGDSCVMTTSCLISGDPFPAEAVTESEVVAWLLSAAEFEQALGESVEFRRFAFTRLSQRLADVIARMEEMRSAPVDRRIADFLLRQGKGEAAVSITHQELALEIGISRETVSRHLKRFESAGWVRLGRASIEIQAPEMLKRISQQ